MKMTHDRPTAPGWYWAEIPNNVPLQPVLVFDGGEGFGLLYTLSAIDDNHDDSDRDGLSLDTAAKCMLWSTESIAMPDGTQ